MQSSERDAGKIVDRVATALSVAFWGTVIFGIGIFFYLNLFPRVCGGHDPRHTEAASTMRQVVTALRLYHNDNGHFPEIGKLSANGKRIVCVGDPACKAASGPNSLIFDVLRDIPRGPNANHALNPKQQKYIEDRAAKDPKNPRGGFADGPQYSEALQGCLLDPWGRQYCIMFTMDDSGTVDVSAVYSDFDIVRMPVVAFSLGKDGIVGGKGYEGKYRPLKATDSPDDAISWE